MPRHRANSKPAARPRTAVAAGSPGPGSAADRRRLMQELRALAHPLRLKLLEHFATGPRTTMQVAAIMGEPPTRLYHHVNALARAGILRLKRTRQVRGTTEKYFEVAKRRFGIVRARDATPAARASLQGLALMVFDEARAELQAAIAAPNELAKNTAPIALRMLMSVPVSRQKRVRHRIKAMIKAIRRDLKGCDDTTAPSWALTLGFSPTGAPKRSR